MQTDKQAIRSRFIAYKDVEPKVWNEVGEAKTFYTRLGTDDRGTSASPIALIFLFTNSPIHDFIGYWARGTVYQQRKAWACLQWVEAWR